jgi:hypothetical protein
MVDVLPLPLLGIPGMMVGAANVSQFFPPNPEGQTHFLQFFGFGNPPHLHMFFALPNWLAQTPRKLSEVVDKKIPIHTFTVVKLVDHHEISE